MARLTKTQRSLLHEWGKGVRDREYKGSTKDYESFIAEHPDAPTLEELYLNFGTFEQVRASVGLGHGGGKRSDRDLTQAKASVLRYRDEVGPVLNGNTYEAFARETEGVMTKSQMRGLLGAQWLRKAAELAPGLKMSRAREIEAGPELEEQLRRVCAGEPLSRRRYDDRRRERFPGYASGSAISRAYAAAGGDGGYSWSRALDAAGIK